MIETERSLARLRAGLAEHEVYGAVRTKQGLRVFMEHHVACVLDFMSLVKRLQAELTCVRLPWTPRSDSELARFVNEIVLDEESDDAFGPRPTSHYEWYLAAMEEIGARTAPVRALEAQLRAGVDPVTAVAQSELPEASKAFARTTFELCRGPLHVVAATFFYGREDVIPQMFLPLVRSLEPTDSSVSLFRRYLERHIAVDGEDHGPLAARLMDDVFGGSTERRAEGLDAGRRALAARAELWDAVCLELNADTVPDAGKIASLVPEPRPWARRRQSTPVD